MPKRFVPAKLHGFLDFMTIGLFITGGDIFKIKDAPASHQALPGDGRARSRSTA